MRTVEAGMVVMMGTSLFTLFLLSTALLQSSFLSAPCRAPREDQQARTGAEGHVVYGNECTSLLATAAAAA
ncbi:hypothetical protein E2C01_075322 [Portunus trituberculatus]|uniref:Uncharacterized protein n=1 Tax=Portunus trituberculatus TaxID=210409 RepID=A0A5B7IJT4_PORTR|nr:hypothetical protein [Portunus trituberculatus]